MRAEWKGQWEDTVAFDPHNNSMSEVLFLTPFHGRETEAHRSWVLARVHKPSHRKNPRNPASLSASVNIYSLASQNIKNLVFGFVVKVGWQLYTETLTPGVHYCKHSTNVPSLRLHMTSRTRKGQSVYFLSALHRNAPSCRGLLSSPFFLPSQSFSSGFLSFVRYPQSFPLCRSIPVVYVML